MNIPLQDLREEYIKQLRTKKMWWSEEKTEEEVVDKMINAINNSNFPSDWLRHNESLKEACKKFGITKSGELREFVKVEFEKGVGEGVIK